MKYELKKLSADDGRDIYDMLQELPENENGFMNSVCGKTYEEFKKWLEQNEAFAKEKELQDGWKVPTTQFWLYVDGRPVGIGRIRHFLTDKLRQEGGQVGYAIRPGERNKGYGTILLGELIKEARKMKIPEILLTVHNGNEYSKKVALANHGVIEKVSSERHYIRIPCQNV